MRGFPDVVWAWQNYSLQPRTLWLVGGALLRLAPARATACATVQAYAPRAGLVKGTPTTRDHLNSTSVQTCNLAAHRFTE